MTRNGSTRARHYLPFLLLGILTLAPPSPAMAIDTEREDVRAFIDVMVEKRGFDRNYVRTVLERSETRQKILDAISRPAERVLPWHEYRAIFITPKRIEGGLNFMSEHADRLARVSDRTGVPAEIIAAIVGVETFYGQITGSYRVVDALATLGFDYPPRAGFFRGQLEELFLLAREEGIDVTDLVGSYAGAMGPPQFIPSSYRAYAVDGDGDGRRDLLGNWDDILMSIANYFVRHDWRTGEPVSVRGLPVNGFSAPVGNNRLEMSETVASLARRGLVFESGLGASAPAQLISLEGETGPEYWIGFHNFYVITRYNRSPMYALAVYQLASALTEARDADAGAGQPQR